MTQSETTRAVYKQAVMVRHRCQSRACPLCGKRLATDLGDRLEDRLHSYKHVVMVTLTINPFIHSDPREIFEYLKEKHAIGEMVRTLYHQGFLASASYFCAIQFQKSTQHVHFHLLLDAKKPFIPRDVVQRRWDRFSGPASIPDYVGRVGHVDVRSVEDRDRAARYSARSQTVEDGDLPQWYVDRCNQGHQHRTYYGSRGFWPRRLPFGRRYPSAENSSSRSVARKSQPRLRRATRKRMTLSQRHSRCGKLPTVLVVEREPRPDKSWRDVSHRYVCSPSGTFEDWARYWKWNHRKPCGPNASRIELDRDQLEELTELAHIPGWRPRPGLLYGSASQRLTAMGLDLPTVLHESSPVRKS